MIDFNHLVKLYQRARARQTELLDAKPEALELLVSQTKIQNVKTLQAIDREDAHVMLYQTRLEVAPWNFCRGKYHIGTVTLTENCKGFIFNDTKHSYETKSPEAGFTWLRDQVEKELKREQATY